jgi:dCTP deaminase
VFGQLSDAGLLSAIHDQSLAINPWDRTRLQPASVDMLLDRQFRVPKRGHDSPGIIDPRFDQSEHYDLVTLEDDQAFPLQSGDFVLGCTVEEIKLADDLVARVEGKSSLARLGLLVHITAGFIDPGFEGQVTLELVNTAARPILLWPQMPVAQLAVTRMEKPSFQSYGERGKYQGQRGPQLSKYHLNFQNK